LIVNDGGHLRSVVDAKTISRSASSGGLLMFDTTEMRNIASDLRASSKQIRRRNEAAPYRLDAGLIERAASWLEQAADEIERLRNDAIF
jgi:hypothetical protein